MEIRTFKNILTFPDTCLVQNNHLPSNQELKCAHKCALEFFGFFDEIHGFRIEKIKKTLIEEGFGEHFASLLAETCAVEKELSETNCDWASRGMEIFLKRDLNRLE